MGEALYLKVTLELADLGEHGENWVRSKTYPCPRGMHLSLLMEDVDDTIKDAIRIVTHKQKLKAEAAVRKALEVTGESGGDGHV